MNLYVYVLRERCEISLTRAQRVRDKKKQEEEEWANGETQRN